MALDHRRCPPVAAEGMQRMTDIAHYLAEHRFQELFLEELGWDRAAGRIELSVDGRVWDLQKVAQKRGIQVLHGQTDRPTLRNRARLRRLQQKLAGLIHEHVVIYSCDGPRRQVWQWAVRRDDGRRLRHREHPFFSHSPPSRLLHRLNGLRFTLDEEEEVTLIDALRRVRRVLDHDAEFDFFAKHPWYAEQSDRLAQAMEEGGEGALHAFVLFHRPLVNWVAQRFVFFFDGDIEDAAQSGFLGLLHAARRYDRSRGAEFSTYAVHCIEGLCKRDGALWFQSIRVPIHLLWPCLNLQRELERVYAVGGQVAINEYLIELAARDPALAREWPHFHQTRSLKSLSQPSEPEYREARQLPARANPLALGVEHAERREIVRDAVATLKARDAAFVRLKYGFDGEEQTLEQIGQQYGVTRERVRQRLVKILPRLQRLLAPVLKLPMPTRYDEIRDSSEAESVPTASESAELAVVE